MQTQLFSVQNMYVSGALDKNSTDMKHWHGVLNKLVPVEERKLKTHLIDALNSNTVMRKEHANVWDYIQCIGKRRPKQDTGNRLGLYPPKNIATVKNDRDKKKDANKWQKLELAAEEMLQAWYTEMIDIKLHEDIDIDGLVEILNIYHDGIINNKKKETLNILMKGDRMAYPR